MILLALVAVAAQPAEIITYHPGGAGTEALRLMRAPAVIVDGVCNSACAWGWAANPRGCYTPRARLYFHTPADPGTGKQNPVAVAWWARHTPEWAWPEARLSARDLDGVAPERRCK